jgi:hypothetical protein
MFLFGGSDSELTYDAIVKMQVWLFQEEDRGN